MTKEFKYIFSRSFKSIAAVMVMGMAVSSQAGLIDELPLEYYDVDPVFQKVTTSNPASGNFNIADSDNDWLGLNQAGFDPDNEVTTTAAAIFLISDDWDKYDNSPSEEVVIDIFGPGSVIDSDSDKWITFVWGEITGSLLVDLQDDGELNWSATAAEGDFYIKLAAVGANVGGPTTTSNRVPDGGAALALLGSAVLGLACMRRRQ